MSNTTRVYIDYWIRHDPFPSRISLIDFDTLERVASNDNWDDIQATEYAKTMGWAVVDKPRGTSLPVITDQEMLVINALVLAWNEFVKLPIAHGDDNNEFRYIIHRAQDMILSRPGRRWLK